MPEPIATAAPFAAAWRSLPAFGWATLALVVAAGVVGWQGRSIRPNVVALELAPSPQRAREVAHQYQTAGVGTVSLNTLLDCLLFIPAYAAFYWFGSRLASAVFAELGWGAGRRAAGAAGYAGLVAAGLDYVENLGMWGQLGLGPFRRFGSGPCWALTFSASTLKWLLVFLGLLAIVAGLLAWPVGRALAARRR